ncbi:glycosyltransferase family 4 protein [Aliarcobacter cryaerophilus]|uniref:glycosyltransferase family 4 protein n=1 Tax=Aliarcobacter cryaerophilus TaxID=28198 RepID=UPI0021B58255|nr:glycosyltransferase [Aliarcobacter cryaerophilus]MCT7517021.1 glycosyltransferase [Aliarcobacter cryaerophilus]
MNKLIYITNTRIPSEKANSYQSMQMCNSFSKVYNEVEMWIPNSINTYEMKKYKDKPYSFYGIEKTFKIKKLFIIDYWWIHNLNQFLWSNLGAVTFAISVLLNLVIYGKEYTIFTRDWYVLKVLLLGKKLGIIKNKIYFEAHKFSNHLIQNFKKCDGLIVINNYLKELHKKKNIKKIIVSHDGVNFEEYQTIKEYEYSKKEKYTLVYTGNLFTWKGVHTLVDSLKFVNQNVELIIVGGSNEVLDDFRKYIKKSGLVNIILTGHVPKKDTIQYVQKADMLFLPNSAKDKMSFYTSPIKLFEYMAAKRPIIASNLPSICEVLVDRKNAILCEPDNPKDLADKINWVLEHDCTDIVNQAFEDVQEYTWDKRAFNIKDFMERV